MSAVVALVSFGPLPASIKGLVVRTRRSEMQGIAASTEK
jgi:hypothetical protein